MWAFHRREFEPRASKVDDLFITTPGASPLPSPEDAARAVAAGDTSAFRVVVDECGGRVFRMLARMLGNDSGAEDVLQDVLVSAFEALRDGRFDGRSSVYTWVYRIAVNAALDALRRRGRQAQAPPPTAPVSPMAGGVIEARFALRRLEVLLDALPVEQRSALVLKELEGLSSAEVAAALGISEGAVEQRLVRARATLRQRLPDAVD
jgi:RNA polymerase sigma-70 factor (ECF subfamily)